MQELCALVDLDLAMLERFPNALSGGQQQRVAIMRAAFMDPPVMLLDEPMAALDPVVRQSLQHELKSIFQRLRKTVLIVTHDRPYRPSGANDCQGQWITHLSGPSLAENSPTK
jgi:osmoprotectant transport system ATP-binding protein